MPDDHEEEDDALSEPIEPYSRCSLIMAGLLGGFWGFFWLMRNSGGYDVSLRLLWVGYAITPIFALLSLITGMISLKKLRDRGFGQRGLPLISISISIIAILAWITLTMYINYWRHV